MKRTALHWAAVGDAGVPSFASSSEWQQSDTSYFFDALLQSDSIGLLEENVHVLHLPSLGPSQGASSDPK